MNELSGTISPAMALLAKKHLHFLVQNLDFDQIEETQHESYLGAIFDNKLTFNQHTNKMTKKLPIC